jgi:hypothetical protein
VIQILMSRPSFWQFFQVQCQCSWGIGALIFEKLVDFFQFFSCGYAGGGALGSGRIKFVIFKLSFCELL